MNPEQIRELKERAEEYERILSVSTLENAPFIVQVGALTVGVDGTNKTVLQNVPYPTQFTAAAVRQIVNECKFSNKYGENVKPQVYGKNEWYKEQLESLKMTIELFE